MRHPILATGLIELLEARRREKHRPGAISTHDLVFPGALRVEATMEGETIDRIAALIESSRALSGVLALVLASTPPENSPPVKWMLSLTSPIIFASTSIS
jgi:hypothetical protein